MAAAHVTRLVLAARVAPYRLPVRPNVLFHFASRQERLKAVAHSEMKLFTKH